MDLEPRNATRLSRLTGAVLMLGAVTYGVNALLFDRLVFRIAYGGPPGLLTLLESPLWAVYRLAGLIGILLIAGGIVLLLGRLYTREQWGLVVATVGTLVLSVMLFLVEFAIAVHATRNILGGTGGIGLTQSDVELVLTTYQGIGVPLLILAILFLGVTLALVGLTLRRQDRYGSGLGTSGIIIGILVGHIGVGAFVGEFEFQFPEPFSQVLTGAWVLALGVAVIRRS